MWNWIPRWMRCGARGIPAGPDPVSYPARKHEQVSDRARSLWEEAGCPPDRDKEFWFDAEKRFREMQGKVYDINVTKDNVEALGFVKDWITALIQIETAAIGAIGVLIGLKDFPRLPLSIVELLFLAITVLSFTISIIFGVQTLNALPGAAQRIPVSKEALLADIFSIFNTEKGWDLNRNSKIVRVSFLAGVSSFVLLILIRLVCGQQSFHWWPSATPA